jgi:hypothetical protein
VGQGRQVAGTVYLLPVYFLRTKNLSGSKRQVHSGKPALISQNSLLPELAPGLEVGGLRLEIGDWRLEVHL